MSPGIRGDKDEDDDDDDDSVCMCTYVWYTYILPLVCLICKIEETSIQV